MKDIPSIKLFEELIRRAEVVEAFDVLDHLEQAFWQSNYGERLYDPSEMKCLDLDGEEAF